MRTLGQIPHAGAVISLFSWNGKFIVKIEQGPLEQTFKFDHLDFENEADFRAKIDASFLDEVVEGFKKMRATWEKVSTES